MIGVIKNNLQAALEAIALAVVTDRNNAYYSRVRLHAEDGKLWLYASSDLMSVRLPIGANVKTPFDTTVSHDALATFIGALKDLEEINIVMEIDDTALKVRCGKISQHFATLPAANFPLVQGPGSEVGVSLSTSALHTTAEIGGLFALAEKNPSDPTLACVRLLFRQTNSGQMLTLTSTDKFKAVSAGMTITHAPEVWLDKPILVPVSSLQKGITLMRKLGEESVTIAFPDEHRVQIVTTNVTVNIMRGAGTFPAIDEVFKRAVKAASVTLPLSMLKTAVKVAKIANARCALDVSLTEVALTNNGDGDAKGTHFPIPCSVEGEAMKVFVDLTILEKIIGAIQTAGAESIALEFGGPLKNIKARCGASDKPLPIVMQAIFGVLSPDDPKAKTAAKNKKGKPAKDEIAAPAQPEVEAEEAEVEVEVAEIA